MTDSKSSQSGKLLQSTVAPPPDPPVPLLELDPELDDDDEADDEEDVEETDCSPPWPPSPEEDEVCPSSHPTTKLAKRSGRA